MLEYLSTSQEADIIYCLCALFASNKNKQVWHFCRCHFRKELEFPNLGTKILSTFLLSFLATCILYFPFFVVFCFTFLLFPLLFPPLIFFFFLNT